MDLHQTDEYISTSNLSYVAPVDSLHKRDTVLRKVQQD
jgi:hypothetical protein